MTPTATTQQPVESTPAITRALAMAKINEIEAVARKYAHLRNMFDPNDFTLVRRYIDANIREISKSVPVNEVSSVLIDRLKDMDPFWIKNAYPEREDMTLVDLTKLYNYTINVASPITLDDPRIGTKRMCKLLRQSIASIMLVEDYDDRIFLVKALDPDLLKAAYPKIPNITAETILKDPARFFGEENVNTFQPDSKFKFLKNFFGKK